MPDPRKSAKSGAPGCAIAIGGSAGATEAFERFFRAVETNIDGSFIVLHHMDPNQKSLLPELLARWTSLPIETARSGTRLLAQRIYMREPGTLLEIQNGIFVTRPEDPQRREYHPIDRFMVSLAEEYESHAIGIVFSGNGSDGTQGLRSIQQAGGRTLVQDPAEARFPGMPERAITAGVADRVLKAEALGTELSKFIECSMKNVSEQDHESELSLICEILHRKTGHDFSSYKRSTVARRVERRLLANLLPDLNKYIEFLEHDANEPRALLRDLLISVTQFFRDPDAFKALQEQVIPRLFENIGVLNSVRIWVPACATGEEAYSIAILLKEYQRANNLKVSLQIFATDIDRSALELARQGIYPVTVAEHVPPEYLNSYFHRHESGYQISQEIRDLCIFSEHSLLKHPPFSKIDLISCRNLFIYWEPDLQTKILPVFHYSLNPNAFLFLGPAESVSSAAELYKTLDKKHRIFQRAGGISRNHLLFPISVNVHHRSLVPPEAVQKAPGFLERDLGRSITAALLENYAPPAFVITALGEIAYYAGRTGKFLEPPTGVPSNNLFDLIFRPIRPELHALLHRSIKSREEARQSDLLFERDGQARRIHLSVRPLQEFGTELELYLVVLQEVEAPLPHEAHEGRFPAGNDTLVQQLEEELRETREHLQSTIEEVKSSNEELLSMNEELQSANEELQTSKEELQSTNEELETVNSELAKKVEELDETNSDLQNFFQGTLVPILFLDRHFRIQKFTPAVTSLFRLIPTDVGRGILDITSLIETSDLIADCARVLDNLRPLEREVETRDEGQTYLMRISPYRTVNNIIAGVIVSFSEITEVKRAQETRGMLASIVESASDAILSRDVDGLIMSWNSGAERLFGYSADEAIGQRAQMLVPPDRTDEFLRIERTVLRGEPVTNFETERLHKDGHLISLIQTSSPIRDGRGRVKGFSIIYHDITQRKKAELESARLAAIVRSSNDAIISKTLDSVIRSWNEAAAQMFGYSADEMIGKSIKILIPKDRLHEEDTILSSIRRGEKIEHYETIRLRKDGTPIQVSVSISALRDGKGNIIGASKIARDISHQKQTEESLKNAVRARDDFLSIASHELKTPLTSLLMQAQLRKRTLLRGEELSRDRQLQMSEVEERQIARLTRLVDDMLDVARIGSGKLTITPEWVDLELIVREVCERFHSQLETANCSLEINAKNVVQGFWDRFRIEQIVTNLLSNAVKYGPGKPIRVELSATADTAILTVEDQGIGIALEDQERIFKQFERAVTRIDISGLGLGLYIVREIVASHHGKIQVESEPGRGSRFTVTLPLQAKLGATPHTSH